MTRYAYTDTNLLSVKENYHYSALQGSRFVAAFVASRLAILNKLPNTCDETFEGSSLPFGYSHTIHIVWDRLQVDWLVRQFEVNKRLHSSYDLSTRKGFGPTDQIAVYAAFASSLSDFLDGPSRLRHINALLKVNDILCSQPANQRAIVASSLRKSLTAEIVAITNA